MPTDDEFYIKLNRLDEEAQKERDEVLKRQQQERSDLD